MKSRKLPPARPDNGTRWRKSDSLRSIGDVFRTLPRQGQVSLEEPQGRHGQWRPDFI